MADLNAKVPENVDGKYYVDDQCIACDACISEAPGFFKMNEEQGYAFVCKQPITEDDFSQCENAMAACPVEAIGNNS